MDHSKQECYDEGLIDAVKESIQNAYWKPKDYDACKLEFQRNRASTNYNRIEAFVYKVASITKGNRDFP